MPHRARPGLRLATTNCETVQAPARDASRRGGRAIELGADPGRLSRRRVVLVERWCPSKTVSPSASGRMPSLRKPKAATAAAADRHDARSGLLARMHRRTARIDRDRARRASRRRRVSCAATPYGLVADWASSPGLRVRVLPRQGRAQPSGVHASGRADLRWLDAGRGDRCKALGVARAAAITAALSPPMDARPLVHAPSPTTGSVRQVDRKFQSIPTSSR